jgi:hypothetical protein
MTPNRVNTCRGLLTWAIRCASLIVLAVGAYLVLKRVALAIVNRDIQTAFLSWEEIGEGQSFYRGLAMIGVGAGLGGLARTLARWAFPTMPEGCPGCGYERVEQPRCPECGLEGFEPRTPQA